MTSELCLRAAVGLGMVEISKRGPRELPMFLPLDTCRDPGRGQILIATLLNSEFTN